MRHDQGVEKHPDLLEPKILFSGFDALPVGTDGDGLLYVRADADKYWNIAAEKVGLTKTGRDAVAEVHELYLRENSDRDLPTQGDAFVISCPEFPFDLVEQIHRVFETTTLTGRQATIWALDNFALSSRAIADILSIPVVIVEMELLAANEETERVAEASRLLDVPGIDLTMLKPDPTSDDWLGLDWSPWYDLRDRERLLSALPSEPGVYRFRSTRWPGLLYIGETGSKGGLRSRVGKEHAVGLAEDEPLEKNGVGEELANVVKAVGGSLQVSVAAPAIAANRRHRLSLEASLVATCRKETGRTPEAMSNRDPMRGVDTDADVPLPEQVMSTDDSLTVPKWRSWQTVTSPDWMGFDWTEPRPLSERAEVEDLSVCLWRIWEKESDSDERDPILTALGTSTTPVSRLFNLEKDHGSETKFSITDPRLSTTEERKRSRQLRDARYDLLGAHYLATREPPKNQF